MRSSDTVHSSMIGTHSLHEETREGRGEGGGGGGEGEEENQTQEENVRGN